MYDLEKLQSQLNNYIEQRRNHEQMFHQYLGAISVMEEIIANVKKEMQNKPEALDGEVDNKGSEEAA